MLLHGPFVGGAYIYIDPTPSKNVLRINLNAIASQDQCDCVLRAWDARLSCVMAHAGAMGRWDERVPALCREARA